MRSMRLLNRQGCSLSGAIWAAGLCTLFGKNKAHWIPLYSLLNKDQPCFPLNWVGLSEHAATVKKPSGRYTTLISPDRNFVQVVCCSASSWEFQIHPYQEDFASERSNEGAFKFRNKKLIFTFGEGWEKEAQQNFRAAVPRSVKFIFAFADYNAYPANQK